MATTINADPDRLYTLLPAVYREADAEEGYPLRALLRLIGNQAHLLRDDVAQLWDNFFIETCERWAIPYLGELVSNNLLHDIDLAGAARTAEQRFDDLTGPNLRPISAIRTRADVARTIYYRRRKGTPAMLEELARDVTGWGAHVVEFFERLTWTQNLNHLRMHSTGTPDLRRVEIAERVHGPFDVASHAIDVRRIARHEGWYNIGNVGFFLWRLGAYPVRASVARRVGGTAWRMTFSPLGNSMPLFTNARPEASETGLASELHVPAPIRAAAFFEDLRGAQVAVPVPATTAYYGNPAVTDASVLVLVNGVAVPWQRVRCINLSQWTALPQPADDLVGIDVQRGRLIIGQQIPQNAAVTVSWFYGFSADLGGGPYERGKWLVRADALTQQFSVGPAGSGATHATLDAALAAWALAPGTDTIVTILDDATYALTNPITLHRTAALVIQAANRARPHIVPAGNVIRVVPPAAAPFDGAALTLSGLLIEGGVDVTQDIRRLRVLHSTLVPGRSVQEEVAAPPSGPAVRVSGTSAVGDRINGDLRVEIAFSISGPLRLPAHATGGLLLLDSIVDGTEQVGQPRVAAIAGEGGPSGPPATIERTTVFGDVTLIELPLASESVFDGTVNVERQQEGCVRFSYVTAASVTPRRYRCQPALEIDTTIARMRREALERGDPPPTPLEEQALAADINRWLVPGFESSIYGRPEYGQLRVTAPRQIREGAEDGSEMGAFNHLKQPQRETNLRVRLDEYLPVGLEAGFIYVT